MKIISQLLIFVYFQFMNDHTACLEATSGVRIHIHDVVVLVPECRHVGGELEEYLDVADHLEHVDHLGLPVRQGGVETDQI